MYMFRTISRVPLGHAATALSLTICLASFSSYLDTLLVQLTDVRPHGAVPDSPRAHATGSDSSNSVSARLRAPWVPRSPPCSANDIPTINWKRLERDPSSMTAALYSDRALHTREELRYLLLLVHGMQEMGYAVTLYTSSGGGSAGGKRGEPPWRGHIRSASQLLEFAPSLGLPCLDPSMLRVRRWTTPPPPRVRLFISSSQHLHPQVPGIGLVNVFHATPPAGVGSAGTGSNSSSSSSTVSSQRRQEADSARRQLSNQQQRHESGNLPLLLSYDYVVFDSQEAYALGIAALQSSFELADARALLIPSVEALPPAMSFARSAAAPLNGSGTVQGRNHVLNVGKDRLESMQALEVYSRMRAQGQLPDGTRLLLILRGDPRHPDNRKLVDHVLRNGLAQAVEMLPFASLDQANGYQALNETLVQWHLTGRRSAAHAGCAPPLVDGMLRGFLPISTCAGLAARILRHGIDGFAADSTDELAAQTAALFAMPEGLRRRMRNASVSRAQGYSFAAFRNTLEKIEGRGVASRPFRHLLSSTLPLVRACASPNVSSPSSAPNAAVIVEARAHYALEYVILNTMASLAKSSHPWSLHVYAAPENQWLVARLVADPRLAGLRLHSLPELQMNSSVHAYNSMMKSEAFWASLGPGVEKALVFQTDSLLLGQSIDEFMGYDYVGAPWHTDNERWAEITASIPQAVGNGGLSLRTVPVMREIVARFPSARPEEMEDMYFARHVYRLNKSRLSSRQHAYKFGIEVPCKDLDPYVQGPPFSVHAAWYYVPLPRTLVLLQESLNALLR